MTDSAPHTMNLDDATLTRLATEAGLCFAQCWNIELYLDAQGQKQDAEWIRSAPTTPERRRRQDIFDTSNHRAKDALSKLRRFAELLNDAVKAAGESKDPLESNDLSHLSDEEFLALAPQGYHAPGDFTSKREGGGDP